MNKRFKHTIISIVASAALLCPLVLTQANHYHSHVVKADDERGYSPFDDDLSGDTAGTYDKNYTGTQPHDSEAQAADQLWNDNPVSNSMAENKEQEEHDLEYTPNPVDLKLHFYYYDPTDTSNKSNFADIQDGIFNKGDTVHVDQLFKEAGHGHGYGYAESSNPVVGNYSDFTIENNKVWWIPVKATTDIMSAVIHLSYPDGTPQGSVEVDNLNPGQKLDLSQAVRNQGFTPVKSKDVVTIPYYLDDDTNYNVTITGENADNSSSGGTEDTDGDISVQFQTPDGSYLGLGDFNGLTVGSTFNLSDAARKYGYTPIDSDQTMTVPAFGSSDSYPTVIVKASNDSSDNDNSNNTVDTNSSDNNDDTSLNDGPDTTNHDSDTDSTPTSNSDTDMANTEDNDDYTEPVHHKSKKSHKSNSHKESTDDSQTISKKTQNRWLAKHTYNARAKVHYVRYRGFSYKQWRSAFIANDSNALGLTKNYTAVKQAIAKNKRYKATVTVKPWQAVQVKIAKRISKKNYIYRVKYRGKYYYYSAHHDKYDSNISPVSATYSDGSFESTIKPWWQKNIYLNYRHKLNKKSTWDYNYGDLSEEDSYYDLRGNKWHETLDSSDAPE